jgi:biotin carboxylase
MSKKLLVLGASRYQLPIIAKARTMGLQVAVCDNRPDNPGHRLSGVKSFICDTSNSEGVLAIAEREGVEAVIAPATDVAMPSLALCAEKLGLPGPSVEAARTLTRKASFRAFQKELGLPSPDFSVFSEPKWPEDVPRRGGPWAIKPNASSGAKGVFRVVTPDEFLRFVPETLKYSVDRTGVIESWLEGSQHTCEGVLIHGKIRGLMLTDRATAPPPYAATWGHFTPPVGFEQRLEDRLTEQIETVFARLGVTEGPFDCDFVTSDSESFSERTPVILELSPRLGGNSLSTMYKACMRADIERHAIGYACGSDFPFEPRKVPRCAAVILFGVSSRGRLSWSREDASRISKEQWVMRFEMDYKFGARVEPFINGRNRVGEAIIYGDSPRSLRILADSLRKRLDVKAV